MAIGQEARPAGDAEPADAWPDVIAIKVWLIAQGGQYYALAEDFDIAGMGASAAEALNDMADLVCGYFTSAVADGLSFEDARRPIPLGERLRFHAIRLVSLPARWLRQKSVAREGAFILPRWVDGHAHC
jgi:hypothetical protein